MRLFLFSHLVAREAADHDVLTRLRRRGRAQVLDRLTAVLVLVHVLLVPKHDLLEPLAQPALGDRPGPGARGREPPSLRATGAAGARRSSAERSRACRRPAPRRSAARAAD